MPDQTHEKEKVPTKNVILELLKEVMEYTKLHVMN